MAFEVTDRASVQLFLGLPSGAKISRQTIWNYRQILDETGVVEEVVWRHLVELKETSLLSSEQTNPLILDSSFVEARKQRNTPEENERIKKEPGITKEDLWPGEKNKHKRFHKDIKATWTKKRNQVFFGYKIHILVESDCNFVIHMVTTTSKEHDSQVLDLMFLKEADEGRELYADSAYSGANHIELVRSFGLTPCICEKDQKNQPLKPLQKFANKEKSKTRSRVEHVFGVIEGTMKGSTLRTVGFTRARGHCLLTMFCYNLCRQKTLINCKQVE